MTHRTILGLAVLLSLVMSACGHPTSKERPVPDLPDTQAKLAFTCAYEKDKIPPRDPEAEQLYQHARWLKKNNLLKEEEMNKEGMKEAYEAWKNIMNENKKGRLYKQAPIASLVEFFSGTKDRSDMD